MKPMKIVSVEDMHVAGGFRGNLSYLKIVTDEGLVGWSEFNDEFRSPNHPRRAGLTVMIREYAKRLIGMNPLDLTAIEVSLRGGLIRPHVGFEQYAIGALVNGCLDIKAKAHGVRVCDLYGGAVREKIPVYWSHCGSNRFRFPQCIDAPPVKTLDDIRTLGGEVVEKGFLALKTNPFGDQMDGSGRKYADRLTQGYPRRVAFQGMLQGVGDLLSAFQDGTGGEVRMMLDVNDMFRTADMRRLAKFVEPFDLQWLEFDNLSPADFAQIRWSTSTQIGSGETLLSARDLHPYLIAGSFDVCIIDVQYVGLPEALRMASLADAFDVNVAAHDAYSGLSTLFGAHLCASVPNLAMMEFDVDQPRWMDQILSHPPIPTDGQFVMPTRPGWGTDVREEGVLANPPAVNPHAPWLHDYHRKAGAI